MKINLRTTLLSFLLFAASSTLNAQNKSDQPGNLLPVPPGSEHCPGLPAPSPVNQLPLALFDVQFVYDIGDSCGYQGNAGVAFTGTEFWVSRWASDTLFSFSPTGQCTDTFSIPTVTGIRAMTWDGTNIFAANNTATIYKINPATRTVISTISYAGGNVRHCAYDPTADGGAGGFWVGNFNTDIDLIDLAGNLLNTIPAATHTLGGMYGSAVDTVSSGGPFLWVFHQGGASQSNLAQINLTTGTPTLAYHDAMTDAGSAGSATSSLAGGLFITDQLVGGQWTLCGVMQATPSNLLFGYELGDYIPPAVDASNDTLHLNPGYTMFPEGQANGLNFDCNIRNVGSDPLNTVNFNLTVKRGATTVFTDTQTTTNLASGSNVTLSSGLFNATQQGIYTGLSVATLTGQTDLQPFNDSLEYQFEVTDSTFARDDNNPNGNAYNVGGTDWALITANYSLSTTDTLTSVWIQLETPVAGDTTYAVVYSTDLGTPITPIAQSPIQIISNQTEYVLVFPGGVPLNAGEYAIGVYEGFDASIGLAQSSSVFTPGVNWVYTPTDFWFPSGIQTSRFIRPNFGNVSIVGVEKPVQETVQVNVYPNPASGVLNVKAESSTIQELNLRSLAGVLISSETPGATSTSMDVSALSAGVYFLEVMTEKGSVVKKVTISK
jgi:Secretion system C-terminal sorting domain